jgi:hypothetical protein
MLRSFFQVKVLKRSPTFQALFGVSTKSGGKIPFQKEKTPSVWYIVFMQCAIDV